MIDDTTGGFPEYLSVKGLMAAYNVSSISKETIQGVFRKHKVPFIMNGNTHEYNTGMAIDVLLKKSQKVSNLTKYRKKWAVLASRIKDGPRHIPETTYEHKTTSKIDKIYQKAEERARDLVFGYFIKNSIKEIKDKSAVGSGKPRVMDELVSLLIGHYKYKSLQQKRGLYIDLHCLDVNIAKLPDLKGDNNLLLKVAESVKENKEIDAETAMEYLFQDFLPDYPEAEKNKIFRDIFEDMEKNLQWLINAKDNSGFFKPLEIVKMTFRGWYKSTIEAKLERFNKKSREKRPDSGDTWSWLENLTYGSAED